MADLLSLLRQTGLNEYESKAYSVLLEMDSASAADVSRKAGIPRARVYDVLVGLDKKGFLVQEPVRPVRFRAFHPETALANLERARKQNFSAELSSLSELKAIIGKHADSLKKSNSLQDNGETAFLVSGAANIEAKVEELLRSASKEAVICCTAESNIPRKTALLEKILKGNAANLPVKVQPSSSGRFMVFDEKKSLLFLNHEPKADEKALLIESESIARFLKEAARQNQ